MTQAKRGNARVAVLQALLLVPLLLPPVAADSAARRYDLSVGLGAADEDLGIVTDCQTEPGRTDCLLLRKAVGDAPALGGARFDAEPVVGRGVRVTGTDSWSTNPHLTLAIDVDGDGCAGCSEGDVVMQGCGAVNGIVLHTTRGDLVTVYVHTLHVDPTTAETCLATSGLLELSW